MGDAYVNSIKSINTEIKNINKRLKELRNMKKQQEDYLMEYMKIMNMKEYKGHNLEKMEKSRMKLESKKIRDEKVKNYIRKGGIAHPDKFYEEIESIRKTKK